MICPNLLLNATWFKLKAIMSLLQLLNYLILLLHFWRFIQKFLIHMVSRNVFDLGATGSIALHDLADLLVCSLLLNFYKTNKVIENHRSQTACIDLVQARFVSFELFLIINLLLDIFLNACKSIGFTFNVHEFSHLDRYGQALLHFLHRLWAYAVIFKNKQIFFWQ